MLKLLTFFTILTLLINCTGQLPPSLISPKREVTIRPEMSIAAIAESLRQKQVINSVLVFRFLVWLNKYENQIKPGRYRFAPNTDPRLVLKTLVREIPALLMVTIPEGSTTEQIARLLAENGICSADRFLAACTDTALLRALGIPFSTVEGYLFPETYEFQTGSEPETIVRRLVRQCRLVLTNLKKENKTALAEPQAIILASIIEKEAKVPEEFPIIAGVFINRLRRNIPLQSCATVEFLLPKQKERLSLNDLKIPSPYNTYLHPGLPPAPICNPGKLALHAALFPARHSYLYFVSRGDGTHIFSTNSREHESAVRAQSQNQNR